MHIFVDVKLILCKLTFMMKFMYKYSTDILLELIVWTDTFQAGCPEIGHLGFLSKSSAHIQALTGQDLELDFMDTLGIEPEVTHNPHLFMEMMQEKSCFGM